MIPAQFWNHFEQSEWKKRRDGGDGGTSGVFPDVQESEQFRIRRAGRRRGSLYGSPTGFRASTISDTKPSRPPLLRWSRRSER